MNNKKKKKQQLLEFKQVIVVIDIDVQPKTINKNGSKLFSVDLFQSIIYKHIKLIFNNSVVETMFIMINRGCIISYFFLTYLI
jgi:hypothetical protein